MDKTPEDDGYTKHKFGDDAEAIESVLQDAVARLPGDATIVGLQVIFAYSRPSFKAGVVEACGGAVSRASYPPREINRLFARYAQRYEEGGGERCPEHRVAGKSQARQLLDGRGPRRRPRR
jgi:hypothetical protein